MLTSNIQRFGTEMEPGAVSVFRFLSRTKLAKARSCTEPGLATKQMPAKLSIAANGTD